MASTQGTLGSGSTISLFVNNATADQTATQNLLNAAFSALTGAASVVANSASVLQSTTGATLTLAAITTPGVIGVASITGNLTGILALPSGYQVVTNISSSPVTILGNGGTNMLVGSGSNGGLTYNTNGGTGTVVAGGGNNLVGSPSTVSSSYNYTVDGSKNTVVAFSGSNTVNALGANALIGATNGNDLVNLSNLNDTVVIGTGSVTVNVSVGGSALIGAIDANGNPTKSFLTFINASATGSTIFGGAGSDTINGGPGVGGVFVGGTSGNNVITSGTGNTTIFAGGNNDLVSVVGAGNDLVTAASGNETLSAVTATGNDSFTASSGALTVFASTVAGAVDTFSFVKGQTSGSTETIFNFTSNDIISTVGYGAAPSLSSGSAGSSILSLSDGTKITIFGATPTNIKTS